MEWIEKIKDKYFLQGLETVFNFEHNKEDWPFS